MGKREPYKGSRSKVESLVKKMIKDNMYDPNDEELWLINEYDRFGLYAKPMLTSFEKYYDTYIIDAEGNTAEYTRFQGGLYGAPSKSFGSSIGISIQNSFEAKVKPKDSTITELKKIKFLNNLKHFL